MDEDCVYRYFSRDNDEDEYRCRLNGGYCYDLIAMFCKDKKELKKDDANKN